MASTITADNGVVSGSAGIKSSADSSGVLALASGTGTTAVTIDTSQNVGIGTSSPSFKLDVRGSGELRGSMQNTSSSQDSRSSWSVKTTASTYGGALMATNASDSYYQTNAVLLYNFDNQPLIFGTNNTERARIDSSGNVGVGTSSPAINSSGRTIHIHAAGTNQWSLLHTTNGETGALAGRGTIFGQIGTDAYVFNYEAGNLILATNSTERARIDSSGNFTLSSSSAYLYFNNTSQFIRGGAGTQVIVGASSGGFYQQVGGSYYLVTTAGGSTSDETLKTNMQPIQNALAKVCAISGITYEFIDEPMCDADKGTQIGVGAQTVEAQFPEIVLTQEDGKKTVRYDRLVAPLIEAIKEQQALINNLTERLAALEGAK